MYRQMHGERLVWTSLFLVTFLFIASIRGFLSNQVAKLVKYDDYQSLASMAGGSANSKNTTLVIVIGNLRGGESAWRTLYENVLDVNSADLALVIGYQGDKTSSSMYQRSKYLYEFPEYEEWADAVDLIMNSSVWRTTVLPFNNNSSGLFGPVLNRTGSAIINLMARFWAQTRIIEPLNLTTQYDRFIVTRSDHYYCSPHNISELDLNHVWIPEGEGYFRGRCDRHVVCSAQYLFDVLNLLPPLLDPNSVIPYRQGNSKFLDATPERFLEIVWFHTGLLPKVRLFPRTMFVVQRLGVDATRGTTGNRNISSVASENSSVGVLPDELAVKYPHEYQAAVCHCVAQAEGRQQRYRYLSDRVRGSCVQQER